MNVETQYHSRAKELVDLSLDQIDRKCLLRLIIGMMREPLGALLSVLDRLKVYEQDSRVPQLDELLKTMLRNAGGDCLTPEEHKNMIERCHRLLGNVDAQEAAAAEEDNRPMHEKLKAAEKEVSADYDSLPPEPKPQDYPNNNIPQQVLDDYHPIMRQKRALNAMRRMFERLAESVCMDPPPECPIGLEPIPPEHVALFPADKCTPADLLWVSGWVGEWVSEWVLHLGLWSC